LNRFGRFALESWQTLAPAALSQPGEDFFTKAGRVEAAKMQAEEMIRADLLIPPEELQEPEEGAGPGPLNEVMQAWRGVLDEDS
jgi:hypothetical protein